MKSDEINVAIEELISRKAIQELFQAKPKGGDTLKLFAGEKWHLCRIDDILIDYIPNNTASRYHDCKEACEYELGIVVCTCIYMCVYTCT